MARSNGGSISTKLRDPFSGSGLYTPGLRVGTNSQRPFTLPRQLRTVTTMRPRAMASNSSVIVAIGSDGSGTTPIAYSSPTGLDWTNRTLPASKVWQDVVWTGVRFLASNATTPTSAVTTDGATWSAGPTLPAAGCYLHLFGTTLVAFPNAGGTTYYTSTNDGASWTTRTFPVAITAGQIQCSKASNASRMVVIPVMPPAGVVAQPYYTTDAISWTAGGAITVAGFDGSLGKHKLVATPDRFIYVASTHANNYFQLVSMVSSDATSWSAPAILALPGSIWPTGGAFAYNLASSAYGSMSYIGYAPSANMFGNAGAVNGSRVMIPFEYEVMQDQAGSVLFRECRGVIHCTDGNDWVFETDIVSGAMGFNSGAGGFNAVAPTPNGDGFAIGLGSADSATAVLMRTNPNFKEVIHAY